MIYWHLKIKWLYFQKKGQRHWKKLTSCVYRHLTNLCLSLKKILPQYNLKSCMLLLLKQSGVEHWWLCYGIGLRWDGFMSILNNCIVLHVGVWLFNVDILLMGQSLWKSCWNFKNIQRWWTVYIIVLSNFVFNRVACIFTDSLQILI